MKKEEKENEEEGEEGREGRGRERRNTGLKVVYFFYFLKDSYSFV